MAAQPVNKNSHFLTTCRETWKHCYQKNFAPKLDEVEKFKTSVSRGVVERVYFRGDNLEIQVRVNHSVVTARRDVYKRQIMVFVMVYAMICYNIVLNTGTMTNETFLLAFHELTLSLIHI